MSENSSTKEFKQKVKEKYDNTYSDFPKPLQKGKYLFCYTMVIVPVIGFIIFYIGINLNSILLAFRKFVGYDSEFNEIYQTSFYQFGRFWEELHDKNSIIWLSLKNTMLYFGLGLILTPIQFMVSYFLYKKICCYKFFIITFFLPSIISQVLMVNMFSSVISSSGPIAYVLEKAFNFDMPKLLGSDATAMNTILAYSAWLGISGNMIILIGSMNRVPEEMLEAGKLDGCGFFREMWNLVIPCVWGTVSTLVILQFASIFTASGPILLFTNGQYKTSTLSFFIYNAVKNDAQFEYPSAVGLVFTLLGMPIALIVRKISGKIYSDMEY